MTILSSVITEDMAQPDGRRLVILDYTDHLGKPHRITKRVPSGMDLTAHMASFIPRIESSAEWDEVHTQIGLAEQGLNPDKVAQYQVQNVFDRRFLGQCMTLGSEAFWACDPVYQRVLTEGSNAKARANYLDVARNDWLIINTRFTNASGAAWFIDDEKAQRWTDVPEVYR